MDDKEYKKNWDKIWKEVHSFFCNTVCKKAMKYEGVKRKNKSNSVINDKDIFDINEDGTGFIS